MFYTANRVIDDDPMVLAWSSAAKRLSAFFLDRLPCLILFQETSCQLIISKPDLVIEILLAVI